MKESLKQYGIYRKERATQKTKQSDEKQKCFEKKHMIIL